MQGASGSAPVRIDRIPVAGAVRDSLGGLELPGDVSGGWSRYAAPQSRTILVAREAGTVAGAAMLASRPLASYLKIGGVWVSDLAADRDAVEFALISDAERIAWDLGCLVVKREVRPAASVPPGYAGVAAPRIAAPIPDPAPAVPGAQFRWRSPADRPAVPYMRQTTDFTCGTAVLSMILTHFGLLERPERAIEIELWRQATTVLACDPYGLAVVATRRGLRPSMMSVSTDDVLFAERLPTEQDRELRRFIQRDFRRLAEQAGIDTQLRAFDAGELRDRVAAGAMAMVLVDELLVHGEACPHWILIHRVEGEHFIAHDPWTEVSQGESWVDAYEVPLSAAALERIAWTGDPPRRAMVVFSR